MKIVYICHPIGGDVEGNLEKIRKIVRVINHQGYVYVPFVPYYADCVSMDDADTDERARSIANDKQYFDRKVMDELWVFGNRISNGMSSEIAWAKELGIQIKKADLLDLNGKVSIVIGEYKHI